MANRNLKYFTFNCQTVFYQLFGEFDPERYENFVQYKYSFFGKTRICLLIYCLIL